MSLIQEALRRQKEETEGNAPAASEAPHTEAPVPSVLRMQTPPPPPAPPTVPATAPATPTVPAAAAAPDRPASPARRAWASLIVALVFIATTAWLVSFAYDQWQTAKRSRTAAVPAAEIVRGATVAAPLPPPAPPLTPAPTAALVQAAAAEAAPAPPPAPATSAVPVAPAAPAAMSGTPATAQTETATPQEAVVPEPAPTPPVAWPFVALKGVIGRGAAGSAIINDQVVAVNETVDGVLVTAVKNQGVELEYKGEKRFLKVGSATR